MICLTPQRKEQPRRTAGLSLFCAVLKSPRGRTPRPFRPRGRLSQTETPPNWAAFLFGGEWRTSIESISNKKTLHTEVQGTVLCCDDFIHGCVVFLMRDGIEVLKREAKPDFRAMELWKQTVVITLATP